MAMKNGFGSVFCISMLTAAAMSAAEVEYEPGPKGLKTLRCEVATPAVSLLAAPEHGALSCTAKLRKADGTEYDGGAPLSIEPGDTKDIFNLKFPWGQVSCEFRAVKNRLLALFTVINSSSDDLLDCEVQIARLTFPEPPQGTMVDGGWLGTGCGPYVPRNGMYGCPEIATPIIRLDFKSAVLDVCSDDPATPTAVFLKTAEDKMNMRYPLAVQVVRERYNPLPAGKTAKAAVSLRFSKPGTPWTLSAADIFGKYYAVYPFRNAWQDSRMMTSDSANRFITRELLKERGVDGCRKAMNEQADIMIKVMLSNNVSTMIEWEPTGASQNGEDAPMYTGSPEDVERILPPEGVAIIDEWFKRFRDAGLKVGCCLRPQELVWVHGRATAHMPPDDPAKLLIRKARWAQKRWGCTVFYVDSFHNSYDPFGSEKYTQDHFTSALDTDYLQQAAEACPDVLLCPEQKTSRSLAYGAPWNITVKPMRDQYPSAFSLNPRVWNFNTKAIKSKEKFDIAKLDAAEFAKVVEWVRGGDIILLPTHYPANTFLVGLEAYKQTRMLPTAVLKTPEHNATCLAGKELTLAADAASSDGTVRKVEFFCATIDAGAAKVGESEHAPFTCQWLPPAPGRHVLYVRATDNAGLTRDSAAAVVWVNARPGPQIRVLGRVREIQDGSNSPRLADGTDFGAPWERIGSAERTFFIENTGTEALKLAGSPAIEGSADFSLAAQPELAVPPGKRTEFSIRFAPVGTGVRNANVTIPLAGGGPFTFQIRGTGKTASARRINCGGPAIGEFNEDCGFQGGWGSPFRTKVRVPGNFDPSKVGNPPPKDVYATARFGDSIYTVSGLTAGKRYRIRLHFNEPSKDPYGKPNGLAAVGKRKFEVRINSRPVLTDFDVFAEAGGTDKALVKEFSATAGDKGEIVIEFVGSAVINAIETADEK